MAPPLGAMFACMALISVAAYFFSTLDAHVAGQTVRLVAGGHASVEDVDIGIREGLALRWSFMGPFETIDLNAPGGIADYIRRYGPACSHPRNR